MFNHIRDMEDIVFLFALVVVIHLKIECSNVVVFIVLKRFCWSSQAVMKKYTEGYTWVEVKKEIER